MVFNLNINELTDFYFIYDDDNVKKIEYKKINENTIFLFNDWFIIDREILNSKNLKLLCRNINDNYFYDDILYDKTYFNHLIDLNKYQNYPPYYLEKYEKPAELAVLSLSSNDDLFVKIFIDYYSKITNIENIFIIDHGSEFISDYYNCGVQVIKIPKGYESELNKVKFIETFQRFLFTKYKWVLKIDLDELIIFKNGPNKIKNYLMSIDRDIIIRPSKGYNLIQNYHVEDDIDINRNISDQRDYMIFSQDYCKPSISNIPINWSIGFHQCFNEDKLFDSDDFIMIHLAFVSLKERYRRNKLFYDIKRTNNELKIVGAGKTDTFDTIEKIKNGIDNMLKQDVVVMPDWIKGQF